MTLAQVLIKRRRFEAAFWKRVNKTDSCWLWTGGRTDEGYGYLSVRAPSGKGARLFRAHRLAWFLFRGDIPDALVPDHLCHVRHCVNPDHIELVPVRTNTLRGRNNPIAQNAVKTHCKHGHEFTEANTKMRGPGQKHRECLTCYEEMLKRRKRATR